MGAESGAWLCYGSVAHRVCFGGEGMLQADSANGCELSGKWIQTKCCFVLWTVCCSGSSWELSAHGADLKMQTFAVNRFLYLGCPMVWSVTDFYNNKGHNMLNLGFWATAYGIYLSLCLLANHIFLFSVFLFFFFSENKQKTNVESLLIMKLSWTCCLLG